MEFTEIPVQILSLEEGDILVLRMPVGWTDSQYNNAYKATVAVMEQAQRRNPILLCPQNVDMAVLRREDAK